MTIFYKATKAAAIWFAAAFVVFVPHASCKNVVRLKSLSEIRW